VDMLKHKAVFVVRGVVMSFTDEVFSILLTLLSLTVLDSWFVVLQSVLQLAALEVLLSGLLSAPSVTKLNVKSLASVETHIAAVSQ